MRSTLTVFFLLLGAVLVHGFGLDLGFDLGGGRVCAPTYTAVNPALLTYTSATAAFGNVTTGRTKYFTRLLRNTGGVTATGLLQAGLSRPFSLYSTTCKGTTLAAGGSCASTIAFAPYSARSFTGTLTASATGATSGTVNVSGTGLAGTITVTDSFTYSNGELPTVSSGAWTTPSWGFPISVISNRIGYTTDNLNDRVAYYTNWTGGNNQCVQLLATTRINGSGPVLRMNTSTNTYYYWEVNGGSIKRVTAGTPVNLAAGGTTANGETLKLCIMGSTLTWYRNGSLVNTYVDATPIASGQPGIILRQFANFDDVVISNTP